MSEKAQKIIEEIDLEVTAIGNKRIEEFVSSGSDLLDIISGGGYEKGTIVNIIGDSSTGKTFLAAEAVYQAKLRYGKKVKVRYLDKEKGFKFDTKDMYGYDIREDLVKGVSSIQEFAADYGAFIKKLKNDQFGFYILDSFDSICSDSDLEEYDARVSEYEKGKTYSKGSMDMQKQKYSSKFFRTISDLTAEKNVVLIIISQIRDNVGETYGTKWKVSGGKALQFYSSLRIFLKRKEEFKIVGYDKVERAFGYCIEAKSLKSRCKWPNRSCYINVFYNTGIDNISSNIDYLFSLKENSGRLVPALCKNIQWTQESASEITSDVLKKFVEDHGKTAELKDFTGRATIGKILEFINTDKELRDDFIESFGVMDREMLIEYIQDNNLEDFLTKRVRKLWQDNENLIIPKRKKKVLSEV